LFVVMEFVDGWCFTDWRYKKHPSAAQLVDVMLPLVRTVADLHKSGVHHRDLNAQNVIIRKEDGSPVLLDFGSVSLPGARTLTQGMPPVNLSVVPPEAFEYARLNGEGARFRGGPSADLYALGVLLYSALTDGLPFNPELTPERLLAAITLRMPRSPHWVNPKAPRSLSAITLRLLAKRPEDRFESAEALHKALWEANKERMSREWRVPLDLPESGPAPVTEEEVYERELEERARRAVEARKVEGDTAPAEKASTDEPPAEEASAHLSTVPGQHTERTWAWARVRRPSVAMACALVAGVVALAWWSRYAPPNSVPETGTPPTPTEVARAGQEVAPPWKWPDPQEAAASPEAAPNPAMTASGAMPPEDSTPVKNLVTVQPKPSSALRAARKMLGTAATCSALLGCPSAQVQVRPAPAPEACPPGALETMAQWGIRPGYHYTVVLARGGARYITVSEGPTTVYGVGDEFRKMPTVELSGHLFFADRVYGRITAAKVDGRLLPVCFELEDLDGGRGLIREPNGGADTAKVFSTADLVMVTRFE
jgi:serine/threonine-protein kinase